MLTYFLVIVAAVALILLVDTVRRSMQRVDPHRLQPLHPVDTAAFRNLLSAEDEEFLRASLRADHYRQLRRARLRALQQYLLWIAESCAVLVAMLRSTAANASSSHKIDLLVKRALRIRLTSLALWILLWAEYMFPRLEIRPFRLLTSYEEFRRSVDSALGQVHRNDGLHPLA